MSANRLARFVEFGKKIVAVGRNYRAHATEMGSPVPSEPIIFLKPTTAYITQGQEIQLPEHATEIHHEVELGIVISTRARAIPESQAMAHVGGYVLALDMTDRVAQHAAKTKGLPWSLAKGFDTSCPVSELIPTDQVPDPHNIGLWLKVNGDTRQTGHTKDMIFSVPFLISWISRRMTLEPGDIILTGTPEGVGPVVAGDKIDCGLEGIVEMSFSVDK